MVRHSVCHHAALVDLPLSLISLTRAVRCSIEPPTPNGAPPMERGKLSAEKMLRAFPLPFSSLTARGPNPSHPVTSRMAQTRPTGPAAGDGQVTAGRFRSQDGQKSSHMDGKSWQGGRTCFSFAGRWHSPRDMWYTFRGWSSYG